jgi:hypothetical protein
LDNYGFLLNAKSEIIQKGFEDGVQYGRKVGSQRE